MQTRIVLAWAATVLSLTLVACGSKGDLVLPKARGAAPASTPVPTAAPSPPQQP